MAKTKTEIQQETRLVKAMVHAQLNNKVEQQPKPEEKPKFRPAKHPARACAPGEARELSTKSHFAKLCSAAGIPATRRQASKYLRKMGVAHRYEKLHPNWHNEPVSE